MEDLTIVEAALYGNTVVDGRPFKETDLDNKKVCILWKYAFLDEPRLHYRNGSIDIRSALFSSKQCIDVLEDHHAVPICGNTQCVNPWHCTLVPKSEVEVISLVETESNADGLYTTRNMDSSLFFMFCVNLS